MKIFIRIVISGNWMLAAPFSVLPNEVSHQRPIERHRSSQLGRVELKRKKDQNPRKDHKQKD